MCSDPIRYPFLKKKTILIVSLLGAIFIFISIRFVYSQKYAYSDFFSFWLAGHMNWTEEDPYMTDAWVQGHHQFGAEWISDPTFLYPLPLAFLFAPLGLFSLGVAYVIWVFLSQVMIFISILLLFFRRNGPKIKHYIFPVFIGVSLFRPVYITLQNGQLGAFFLLILSMVIYFWEKDKWIQGGLLLSFLAVKPSIGIPIIGLLCIWLISRKYWQALLGAFISFLGILAIGWVQDPGWIVRYINISTQKLTSTFGYSPTIWGITASICKHQTKCSLGAGALISILLLLGYVLIISMRRKHIIPSIIIGCVIPIVLLITPYIWAYDQILLIIPIILVQRIMFEKRFPYLVTSTVFLMMSILSLAFIFLAIYVGHDVWSAMVPFTALLLFSWFTLSMVTD